MNDAGTIHEAVVAERREQVALYSALDERQWAAPSLCAGWTVHELLAHDVIHGLDAAVALGREQHVSRERVVTVLGGLGPKHLASFGTDLDGIELSATDADWTHGSGAPVRGRAQDLLLAVCGRPVPAGRLEGAGAARFAP